MKAKRSTKKSAKQKAKQPTAKTAGSGKPQWKKIKLAGKLMSDEGGIGLEGLLGLEVLENPAEALSVFKEKPVRGKREWFQSEEKLDEELGSDNEYSSKKDRKKQLQKKKKTNSKKGCSGDDEPGKFVRMMKPESKSEKTSAGKDAPKKPKKGKGAKVAETIEEPSPDEEKFTVNDLIVSIDIESSTMFNIIILSYLSSRDGMDLV